LVVWRSGRVVRRMNEVTLRRARLVLGWMDDRHSGGYMISVRNQPNYVTSAVFFWCR